MKNIIQNTGYLPERMQSRLDDTMARAKELGYTGDGSDINSFYEGLDDFQKNYYSYGDSQIWQYYLEAQKYKDSNPYYYEQMMSALNNYHSMKFSPNLLQKVGETLGDFSGRSNFENQNLANLNSEFQKIRESLHTEEYSDPSAELARRKAAGINDDLSGGSSLGSGNPGNIDQAEVPPGVVNSGESSVADVVTTSMNIFSSVLGFVQQIKGMQLQNAQLVGQELEGLSSSNNWFRERLIARIPHDIFTGSYTDDDRSILFNKAIRDAVTDIENSADFGYLSRSTRRYLRQSGAILSNGDSLENRALYQELYNRYLKSANENANYVADPRFSTDFDKWVENCVPYVKQYVDLALKNAVNEADIKHSEKELKGFQTQKIKALDNLFDGIEKSIPKEASWKGFATYISEITKVWLTSKMFHM